jgi:hypothetical protein
MGFYPFQPAGGGGGSVNSVSGGDTSIVATNPTGPAVTLVTGTLDVLATLHPAAGAVPFNGQKITGLANGVAGSDGAVFGQLPSSGTPLALTSGGTGVSEANNAALLAALGAAPLASPALTGTPTAPTRTALTDNTDIATTAYADAAVTVETSRAETAEALLAPLASPALTGTPTIGGNPVMRLLASTGTTPYTLVNGTGNIITAAIPNDGALHRVIVIAELIVTSNETGGLIEFTYKDGGGNNRTPTVSAGGASSYGPYNAAFLVAANQTVAVIQASALTAGAAVLYAEIWGS